MTSQVIGQAACSIAWVSSGCDMTKVIISNRRTPGHPGRGNINEYTFRWAFHGGLQLWLNWGCSSGAKEGEDVLLVDMTPLQKMVEPTRSWLVVRYHPDLLEFPQAALPLAEARTKAKIRFNKSQVLSSGVRRAIEDGLVESGWATTLDEFDRNALPT